MFKLKPQKSLCSSLPLPLVIAPTLLLPKIRFINGKRCFDSSIDRGLKFMSDINYEVRQMSSIEQMSFFNHIGAAQTSLTLSNVTSKLQPRINIVNLTQSAGKNSVPITQCLC